MLQALIWIEHSLAGAQLGIEYSLAGAQFGDVGKS